MQNCLLVDKDIYNRIGDDILPYRKERDSRKDMKLKVIEIRNIPREKWR